MSSNVDVRRDSARMTDSVATTVTSSSTSSVTMYTTPWCGYCHRLQGQMDREGIRYDVVDIEQHPDAAAFVESVNHGNQTVPTLVYSDGSAQTNPSVIQVKEKLASL
jgi:mycoredoxin